MADKRTVWALYDVPPEVIQLAKVYQHQNNFKTLGQAVADLIKKGGK